MVKELLDKKDNLREVLFVRGFLITDKKLGIGDVYPFYGKWNFKSVGGFDIWTHHLQKLSTHKIGDNTFFLIGHAYNPFTMEHEETKILAKIADAFCTPGYQDAIDEITGVFVFGYINGKDISIIVDPSGMQSACHGRIKDNYYASSHPQLIGDLCYLEMDKFVKELVNYKWYERVMGPYLPVDMTPFSQLKRIVPNICYNYLNGIISHKRYYPLKEIKECANEKEYQQIIEYAADILKNGMKLVSEKWDRPFVSLSGGIDSNTTFAAANGIYEKFETFSYISALKETIDAEAAENIAKRFNVKHNVYEIPETTDSLNNYDEIIKVLDHNNGYVAKRKANESRKRVYLHQNCPAGVEVKSWVSETIRGYWYKHYGRKSMPKLSGKLFRNLYKIFITNRSLAHKLDRAFSKYIDDYEYHKIPAQYPPADMHYNEVTWGSWGGLNISEMKYCFDITFVYNNRKFLDILFKVPLEKRISDQHHLDMKKYLNKELFDMNSRVINMAETGLRAFMLNIIFTLNMILPF